MKGNCEATSTRNREVPSSLTLALAFASTLALMAIVLVSMPSSIPGVSRRLMLTPLNTKVHVRQNDLDGTDIGTRDNIPLQSAPTLSSGGLSGGLRAASKPLHPGTGAAVTRVLGCEMIGSGPNTIQFGKRSNSKSHQLFPQSLGSGCSIHLHEGTAGDGSGLAFSPRPNAQGVFKSVALTLKDDEFVTSIEGLSNTDGIGYLKISTNHGRNVEAGMTNKQGARFSLRDVRVTHIGGHVREASRDQFVLTDLDVRYH